jgi:adenylate cyclase
MAGLWGAGLGFLHWRGDIWFLDRIEATMSDVRTLIRGTAKPPDTITIVAIDDEAAMKEGYPLRRATMARLIDEIARFDPKVIAVDLLFVDPGEKQEDDALARSLRRRATVIAAAAVFAGGKQWIPPEADGPLVRVPNAERFLMPLGKFADAAAVGIVNVATDQTGTPRLIPLLFRSGDHIEAALPLRVAALVIGAEPEVEADRLLLGLRSVPTDLGHLLPLAFYGPRGTIPTISAATVLAGRTDGEKLRNRIVVIGATVTGGGDVFPTPFDPVLPGVEVISTAIAHLTTGDGIVRDRRVRLADAGFAIVMPMVLVGLVAWRRSAIGMAAVAGVILTWAAINLSAYSNGVWLSAALPIAAAIPPAILFGAAQLWRDRNRAQYFATQSQLLQKVQAPPGLGAWLAKHRDFLAKPVRGELAVVFIDLSGFTGLSETMGPNATRELLSAFHLLIDAEVTECGGIVSSFMGDGAMILFGLPESAADDAAKAVRCSVGLSRRMRNWLASLPNSISSRLGFKIGAHFGTVVASRLGGESHQHITATGDTVNVASRLMEVAARHRSDIAVSNELLQVAGQDCALRRDGVLQGPIETKLRGRSGSLAVWFWKDTEVTGLPERRTLQT